MELVGLLSTGYAYHLYYNLVGHVASLRGVDFGPRLLTWLDRAVPYMPFWVHFYQVAYLVPLVVVAVLIRNLGLDLPRFRRIVFAFVLMLTVHYVLYLSVPTSARAVRLPEEALGEGILGRLVRYQYRLATVWCAWPSFHVAAGWYLFRLLLRHSRIARWIHLAWFSGMLFGTVAIKIHYILDGLTGLGIAEVAYRGVFLKLEAARAFEADAPSAGRLAGYGAVLLLLLGGLPLAMRASGFTGPLYTIGPLR
jgi:hypothetical protein